MNMVSPIERPDQLLGALRDKLGAAAVLVGTDVPARNCNDWSASLPQAPLAVIRPVDAQGVADAIGTCRQARRSRATCGRRRTGSFPIPRPRS